MKYNWVAKNDFNKSAVHRDKKRASKLKRCDKHKARVYDY